MANRILGLFADFCSTWQAESAINENVTITVSLIGISFFIVLQFVKGLLIFMERDKGIQIRFQIGISITIHVPIIGHAILITPHDLP